MRVECRYRRDAMTLDQSISLSHNYIRRARSRMRCFGIEPFRAGYIKDHLSHFHTFILGTMTNTSGTHKILLLTQGQHQMKNRENRKLKV